MDRLAWDLYNIPHHCSYLALSDEKGEFETIPKPLVEEILMSGKKGAYIVSSSWSIVDTVESREQIQPPHIQAKKSYETYRKKTGGAKFLVTMDEPNSTNPKPLEFKIDNLGLSLVRSATTAGAILTSNPAPRAG